MLVLPKNIARPARYLGIEPGRVMKEVRPGDVRFALCYPDVYEIGMSYFGFFLLYELLNSIDGVWCERCFAPWLDMDEYLRGGISPCLPSNRIPPSDRWMWWASRSATS